MDNVKVDVASIDGSTLNSRDEAVKLFNFLQVNYLSAVTVVLNFANVEFMSRSFADQFYQLKKNWELQKKSNIQLENPSKQINEILDAVSRSQYNRDNKRQEIKRDITALHFTEMEEFEEYLSEI
jgi:hypothetical protein